ncbi:uncharacterized protein LOC121381064 [Gigantopelta aegis]|uniref:uncharacterized protein LOC121381064 n=1 Tax=Gigantopelta aegis TaxID=1735272 RepID=UPI001B88A195|nr:uncharacterized protein LOC121381064 [Gigantopelta aegis]
MGTRWTIAVLAFIMALIKHTESIMCHRCYSAMGGCGDEVVWRMFPWRDCGPSNFCVKVVEEIPGEQPKYIRECEHILLQSTRHRLQMPNLRRHGYCTPARKNDPSNPLQLTNSNIKYCFCNEYNGCNTAPSQTVITMPLMMFSAVLTLVTKLL